MRFCVKRSRPRHLERAIIEASVQRSRCPIAVAVLAFATMKQLLTSQDMTTHTAAAAASRRYCTELLS